MSCATIFGVGSNQDYETVASNSNLLSKSLARNIILMFERNALEITILRKEKTNRQLSSINKYSRNKNHLI